jgi:hypothetical protein
MRPIILSHASREFVNEHASQHIDGLSVVGSVVLLVFAIVIFATTSGHLWAALKGDTRFR